MLATAGTIFHRIRRANAGRIARCCHAGGAEQDTILDDINGPRGLALIPDGSLAIASDGKGILYRPVSLGEDS